MKCVTYNVQYGVGLDGAYDIGRIAEAVRGADLIALQEVTRNNPRNGGRDMVAELREALPEHFAVYGPNFEAEMGSHVKDGRAVDVRLEFGNMVLSKTPILASRNLLLPRRRSLDVLNLQRGAIEALVETSLGPIRFYSIHLDHRAPDERIDQLDFLMNRVLAYPLEGGAITGTAEFGFPEPPRPEAFVLMGDFNMLPGSEEYVGLVGRSDHAFGLPRVASKPVDAALVGEAEPATTWVEPKEPENRKLWKRIDYVFTSAELADSVKHTWVDEDAKGSDHLPVWVEF
jgi:endonuclease/exonuclease/phosphatase family metal-dependent hydrolase